jgi:hypothetical protein
MDEYAGWGGTMQLPQSPIGPWVKSTLGTRSPAENAIEAAPAAAAGAAASAAGAAASSMFGISGPEFLLGIGAVGAMLLGLYLLAGAPKPEVIPIPA